MGLDGPVALEESLGEVPRLVRLARRSANELNRRLGLGEVDADGLTDNVGCAGDRRQLVARRIRLNRYERVLCIDRQDLSEGASVAAAIGHAGNNGVFAVAERSIGGHGPCPTSCGCRLIRLGDAVNGDGDCCRGTDIGEARDCRLCDSGVDRSTTGDRQGWRT